MRINSIFLQNHKFGLSIEFTSKTPNFEKTHFHKSQQIDQLIITQDRLHNIMIKWVNLTSQFHQFKPNWIKTTIRVVSSPRNFNFSQFIKLIKLIHQEQIYIVPRQKPINQFPKKKLESSKIPILHRFEIYPTMHELMHETINKWKEKSNKVLPALKDKNLAKILKENDKNFLWLLDRSKRERKVFWKSFE